MVLKFNQKFIFKMTFTLLSGDGDVGYNRL